VPDSGSIPVAVLGATGFGGALCARLVDRHPSLELTAATARAEAGRRHDEIYPRYGVDRVLEVFDADAVAERAQAALVAYPHRAAAPAVRALRERGLRVVDLSADFRLDRERYERWYQPHEAPELLDEAVYGLPEAHREEIRGASLVAGPGCNSTAALLATLPLRGRIEDAVFDIKAGVSGAGREATEETHYSSAAENVNAYKVEGHRHSAEIEQELAPERFSFVTHLMPLDQGILASCYLTVPGLGADEARALYREHYAGEPVVEVVDEPPHTRHVQDSNRCRVHVTVVGDRTIAFAAIDNLWKGAAGQALQDLNLMLGLPEDAGLR
jgi:N-acetyl-gamma-glutamyl-phosphate reductase